MQKDFPFPILDKISHKLSKKFLRVLAILFITYLIVMTLHILLAHILGAARYGDFFVAFRIIALGGVLAFLGLQRSITKYIPIYISSKQWEKTSGFLRFSHKIIFITSVIIVFIQSVILAFIFLLHQQNVISFSDTHPVLLFFWLIPIVALSKYLSALLKSINKPELATLTIRFSDVILVTIIIIMAAFYSNASVFQLLIILALAVIVSAIVQLLTFIHNMPTNLYYSPPAYDKKLWFFESLKFLKNNAALQVLLTIEVITFEILSKQEKEVGIFIALLAITEILHILPRSLQTITIPYVGPYIAEARHTELQKIVNLKNRYMWVLGLALAVLVMFFGHQILALFGNEFRVTNTTLIMSVITAFISIIGRPSTIIIAYSGHQSVLSFLLFQGIILTVLLMTLFVPFMGILGAFISITLCRSYLLIFRVYYAKKYIPNVKPLSFI